MKFTTRQYAEAIIDIFEKEPAKNQGFAKRLGKVLQKNGDEKKLRDIIRATDELYLKRAGGRRIEISVANDESLAQVRKKIKVTDLVSENTDKNLYGGARITIDGNRADTTLHHRLQELRSALGLDSSRSVNHDHFSHSSATVAPQENKNN